MKVIKIGALWCPGCIIINKHMSKIMNEYPTLEVIEYDYDFDSEDVTKFNVGTILPVLIFLGENGEEMSRLIGEKPYEAIKKEIDGSR